MLRLTTFCMLLAFAVAQSGYEYNKPGKPFRQGTTLNKDSYSSSPGGFQGPATTPVYQSQEVKRDDYSNSAAGSTPTFPPTSGYPSGFSQGFSNLEQQTQPGYSKQTPSGPPFGQVSSGPSSALPEQTGSNYPGQGQIYLAKNQQSYAGQIGRPGQPDAPRGQNYPSQISSSSHNPPGGQSYSGQPGLSNPPDGGLGHADALGYGPPSTGFGQPNAGFGQANPGIGRSNEFGSDNTDVYEGGDYSAIPGEPDIDYPILTDIPKTSFRCDVQAYPGYYADVETRCQVFHVCANNRTYDFICPNGTIFSQKVFVCVWWNQFDCNLAPGFYELNANLYDYSKTGSAAPNAYRPGSNDYSQGQQSTSSYPLGAPGLQGPSENYPESTGSQSLAGFPGGPGSPGYPSTSGSQGPTGNYPGALDAQHSFSGSSGSQEQSNIYTGSAPQTPDTSYPGPASQSSSNSHLSSGVQGQPSVYPGSSVSSSYLGSPQGQSNYPSSTPQGPSSSYLGSLSPRPDPKGKPTTYSGAAPQAPSSSFPGSVSQGSSGYPGSSQSSVTSGYPISVPQQREPPQAPSSYPVFIPERNQGYPSGKPSGSSFSTGGKPQQPNREYLPPRN